MKKIILLLSVLTALITLVSCTFNTGETSTVLFSNRTVVMEVGQTQALTLDNPGDVQMADVVFGTENAMVVTVSDAGVLTAVGSGFTAVSLTHNEQTDYLIVSVYDPNDLPQDGKEIALRVNQGYIQWQYVGETTWTNLVGLESLIGAQGTSGSNGDQVVFRVEGGNIQWKYVTASTWTDLLSLTTITGVDGDHVELRVSDTHIEWKRTKETTWTNLIALSVLAGTNGSDGKEVELRNNGTYIQWRYIGDEAWQNLVLVNDLKGEQGVSVTNIRFETVEDEGGYREGELDVDLQLYRPNSFNNEADSLLFYPNPTMIEDGAWIPYYYEEEGYLIEYSGYGRDGYWNDDLGNPYGREYLVITGTLSENLVLRLQDYSGERPEVLVRIYDLESENLLNSFMVSNWTSFYDGEGDGNIIDVTTLPIGTTDIFITMTVQALGQNDEYLYFEMSNGTIFEFNYSELFRNSQTYADMMRYINTQDSRVRDALLNANALQLFNMQREFYGLFMTAIYNQSNAFYSSNLLDTSGEGAYWFNQMAMASTYQYLYELNQQGLVHFNENNLLHQAFIELFSFGNEFLLDMFDGYYPSYLLADILNLEYVGYGEDELLYGDYLPITPFVEYLRVIEKFDESSFYQYLLLNPNTGWDYYNAYHRWQYITASAMNALEFYVEVELDPRGYGIQINNEQFKFGGEYGIYNPSFHTYYDPFTNLYLEFGREYPTVNIGEDIFDYFMGNNGSRYEFDINYGASFPLPTQNAFTDSEFYTVSDGNGGFRYFKLEGYTYSYYNDYSFNYTINNFEDVAYRTDSYYYWSYQGYYNNPIFNDNDELYIEAVWVEYFVVRFFDAEQGGNVIKTEYVREGGDATAPSAPNAPFGYEFDGWDDWYFDVYENVDVRPIFDPITYYITYENLDNATHTNPGTYNIESATITLTDPTNIPLGYEFLGWYSDSAFENEVTEITTGSYGDITLYAKIQLITYYITYNLDGGDNDFDNPSEFNANDLNITLYSPYKTGYSFEGWYADSNFQTLVTSITTTGNKTLYAKFTINEYTITFNSNGGTPTPNSITQNYNTNVTAPANPTRTGYTFLYWEDQNGNSFSFSTMPAYDSNLTAVWEIDEYLVTFEYSVFNDSNVVIQTQYVNYGSDGSYPTPPTLDGYTFIGWFGDSITNVTSNRVAEARYVANNYQISVLAFGEGSVQVSGRPNVDRTISLVATPEDGFMFANWNVYYYDTNGIKQSITVANSNASTTTFVMPAFNVVIEVTFTLIPDQLP